MPHVSNAHRKCWKSLGSFEYFPWISSLSFSQFYLGQVLALPLPAIYLLGCCADEAALRLLLRSHAGVLLSHSSEPCCGAFLCAFLSFSNSAFLLVYSFTFFLMLSFLLFPSKLFPSPDISRLLSSRIRSCPAPERPNARSCPAWRRGPPTLEGQGLGGCHMLPQQSACSLILID